MATSINIHEVKSVVIRKDKVSSTYWTEFMFYDAAGNKIAEVSAFSDEDHITIDLGDKTKKAA